MNPLIKHFLQTYDKGKIPNITFGYILPEGVFKDRDFVEWVCTNEENKKALICSIKGKTVDETIGEFFIELEKLKDYEPVSTIS
jgi:hypothetical protein